MNYGHFIARLYDDVIWNKSYHFGELPRSIACLAVHVSTIGYVFFHCIGRFSFNSIIQIRIVIAILFVSSSRSMDLMQLKHIIRARQNGGCKILFLRYC
jgi:hypothetical protein